MNNRRYRSTVSTSSSSFYRYLKPGALARLRDSKIINTTRSHRINSKSVTVYDRPLLSSMSVPASPYVDASPCISDRICHGPRFIQKKKLVAARTMSICCLMPPASPVVSVVGDLTAGAYVAAH